MIALLAVAGAVAVIGCTSVRPPKAPMDTFLHKSSCATDARTLLILLPGAYSEPDEFVREGYIPAIEEHRLAVDVLRVDAQLGYYTNGMAILKRFGQDVIAPARQKGYTSIWVTGISIGGLGALAYAALNPGQLDGIVAIAPYLGERATSLDIANAGGLMRWRAPTSTLPGDNAEQRMWAWLRRYGTQPGAPDMPQLYLGFGRDDRFAFSHELLAAVLPADHVFRTDGGHDWPEWRRLWQEILPVLPLPRCPSARG
ncbi:pimeloyl-ACP methyl ester carboxylesterase [Variovorax sp. Sphag1AA]|nr:pimeloyl-ACP methyl ester carboxylesterase [Variovorax sp. Sphag1AA]